MGEPRRGRLAVYLGAAPGVGKTTAMLTEGARLANTGVDVIVALVETHGRAYTDDRSRDLERVPLSHVSYRGSSFDELDVDAVLSRQPQVALVDELAHTNVPGSRHEKRWQDVEELLESGIDVITNLNVAHLDSVNDAVERLTGVAQHETVPDRVVSSAEHLELVDVNPETLRARLSEGAVLPAGATDAGLAGYYQLDHVAALRELALDWLAGQGRRARSAPSPNPTRVVAALTGAPEGRHVVRRAAEIAAGANAELVGLHVREPSGLVDAHPVWLDEQRRLLAELGGRYTEVESVDVARAMLDVCRSEQAQHLVVGTSRRNRRDEVLHGSVIGRTLRAAGAVEVHVIPSQPQRSDPAPRRRRHASRSRVPLPRRRRQLAWSLAFVAPVLCTVALLPARSSVGIAGALFAALLGVVAAAAIGGVGPAAVAIVAGFLTADFFFTRPYYSLRVDHLIDVLALVAFAAVGGAIGVLVDVLSRQAVQVAGARTEAEGLARLAAEAFAAAPEVLPRVAPTLRSTFGLDAVAMLQREGGDWSAVFALGEPIPHRPEATHLNAEMSSGRVLVLVANPSAERDPQLLRSFVTTLRLCREGDQLAQISRGRPPRRSGAPAG